MLYYSISSTSKILIKWWIPWYCGWILLNCKETIQIAATNVGMVSPREIFTWRQPFWCHQVDYHNNRPHSPISLKRTWDTKFWPYRNFVWYFVVTEKSTALATGHFQNGGDIMPTLDFWRQLEIWCIENNIGTYHGDVGKPMWVCRRSQIAEHKLEKVKTYHGKWLPSANKFRISKQKYYNQWSMDR